MKVGDLMDGYLACLESEGATAYKIRSQVKPLLAILGGFQVQDIKGATIDSYRAQRAKAKSVRGSPVEQSTINRELTYFRAALRRAHGDELIDRVPRFRMPKETGERRDWWSAEQLAAVVAELRKRHPCLADLIQFYSASGWRKQEALGLRWDCVDFPHGVVRLPAKSAKERDAKVLPIVGQVKAILERRAKDRPPGCLWVFHRDGVRRMDFRRAWNTARKASGCQNLLHRLRRTMARRYLLAKYPVELIMKMGGWKSREMVERYARLETEDLAAAMLEVEKREVR